MPEVESKPEWLTLRDVMHVLDVGHSTVYRLVESGRIERRPASQGAGVRRYSRASVERVKAEMSATP